MEVKTKVWLLVTTPSNATDKWQCNASCSWYCSVDKCRKTLALNRVTILIIPPIVLALCEVWFSHSGLYTPRRRLYALL